MTSPRDLPHYNLGSRRYETVTASWRTDLVDYLRDHGRRKMLFGSNHPAWPAAECLADLAGLQLDEPTTDLFLHANAERVFGLTR